MAPGYRFFQEMIGRVLAGERKRLTCLLGHAITPVVAQQCDALLEADDRLDRLSTLKHEPKDFSYKELRREVARRQFFQPLYAFAQPFLRATGLSNESVRYYAALVPFYTIYKLQRMSRPITRLSLLCFASQRLRQSNDTLTEACIHLIDHYEQHAKQAAQEALQQARAEANEALHAAGDVLRLFVDDSMPGDTPFARVQAHAFTLLAPERFPLVSDYLRNITFDKTAGEWAYYTTLSPTFKRNLRQVFCALDFAGRVEDAPLWEAVTFLQTRLRHDQSPRQTPLAMFPLTVIPKALHPYLFTTVEGKRTPQRLEVDRYEFLVYRRLRNALEAGDVYVRDSTEFRRFEDDLISETRWQHKDAVLREIGAPLLLAPIHETLAALRETLDAKFTAVNQRSADGTNTHIKVTGVAEKRRWRLRYPSEEAAVNSPFYNQLPGIGIVELLWCVAEQTGCLRAFTHVLARYVKHDPDPRELLACVVALGTNMGLWNMTEVAGLSHAALMTTTRNYLRLETLHAANDAISNAIATLPAFHLYDIRDSMHSSSDGQRMETQIETINARYSPKYFGLKQGVSAYTLVANHVPINAKIIGTHEHESHYVFDLLYNNPSDIKPERHSTDTHGTNQVNFWLLHVFGYQFAPRYRDLHKKIDGLIGAKHPHHYRDCLIKPARKAYDALIIKEWPNIQRIMASLAQKDVTQATLVRKLASYVRQNQTKKALWELENMCRTLYILDFIDDVGLRQSVQKALNRGEAYHRFRRAIAYVHAGKFRVKTEAEQQIWNECSRLIANAVIYDNTALLSRVYEQKRVAGDQQALAILPGISPVAWQHVNLFGSFDFGLSPSTVDLDALAARYADPGYWDLLLQEEGNLR